MEPRTPGEGPSESSQEADFPPLVCFYYLSRSLSKRPWIKQFHLQIAWGCRSAVAREERGGGEGRVRSPRSPARPPPDVVSERTSALGGGAARSRPLRSARCPREASRRLAVSRGSGCALGTLPPGQGPVARACGKPAQSRFPDGRCGAGCRPGAGAVDPRGAELSAAGPLSCRTWTRRGSQALPAELSRESRTFAVLTHPRHTG